MDLGLISSGGVIEAMGMEEGGVLAISLNIRK